MSTQTIIAAVAPLEPPAAWFEDPQLEDVTPLTITKDGRVFGHAAPWNACHTAYPGRCLPPPRSRTGYSHFHVGAIVTAEGEEIPVGRITLASGHASTGYGMNEAAARAHYDDTGTVAAFVRAGEDEYGIWVAGALRSNISPELLVDLRANPLSGDWRGGELIAAHCVPTPGYRVPRLSARLAASAAEPLLALVASTGLMPVVEEPPGQRFARPGRGR